MGDTEGFVAEGLAGRRTIVVSGASIFCLGPPESAKAVVVLGRGNTRRPSAFIDQVILDLRAAGHTIFWYESRRVQTARLLEERLSAWFGAPPGGILRKPLMGLVLLLCHPSRWDHFLTVFRRGPLAEVRGLRRFLRRLRAGHIVLLGHSAGGILATRVADEPAVRAIVCVGYPFRHPERPPEAYRTGHLAGVDKPVLIVQGRRDAYGSPEDALALPLSPSFRVEPVDDDHDYSGLPAPEACQVRDLIRDFVDFGK